MTTPQAGPLLEISNLTLRRGSTELVRGLSMNVEAGTVHALVGENGSGKTTFAQALLGLVPFEGRIIAHWRGRGRVAYVPQQFETDRALPVTVADFLALSRQRSPVCLGVGRATLARLTKLLGRVGAAGLERRPLSALSGGEMKRVLLANALDPIPELLILDEPAAGLDETGLRWLDDTLIALKGEMTVLLISHDPAQVARVADRVTALTPRLAAVS